MLLAGHLAQVHGKVRTFDAPQLRVGIQLDAHFQGGVFPLLAGAIELDGVGEALADGPCGVLGRVLLGDVGGVHGAMGLVGVGCVSGFVRYVHVGAGSIGLGGGSARATLAFGCLARLARCVFSFGNDDGMPGAMVVHVETSAEAGELVVGCAGGALVAQGGVDTLGSHEAGLFGHALQLGTRGCRLGRARGRKIELVDHRFHHHVAGDVP